MIELTIQFEKENGHITMSTHGCDDRTVITIMAYLLGEYLERQNPSKEKLDKAIRSYCNAIRIFFKTTTWDELNKENNNEATKIDT